MIGSIVLTLALACSVSAMVMYFLNYRGYKNTLNYGRLFYHLTAIFVIISAAVLWAAILRHDYSLRYVYDYSSNDLPLGYLIATFWGGQEGSFMLWLLLSSIVGIILQSYSSKRGDLEPRVMAVFTLAITFLLVMVSPMFKNPFAYIWSEEIYISAANINHTFFNLPWLQSFLFSDPASGESFVKMEPRLYSALSSAGISINQFIIDGKGLNPQLLNFWMQIHPPILFTGFSLAAVPFTFAMAAMMKNEYNSWVRQAFPWVLAGMGILGLGIMLGGYWAYEMLGWGGYWAWDPVENSSLIPWLVGVASIHTLLVQRKSQARLGIGKYAKTNLVLCISTYILVLYSTFLTRSGVLGDASVHSFVDPGMVVYLFLLIFIGTFILIGFGALIYRWKSLNVKLPHEESLMSRDLALFTAAVVLCASAIIVLVGTSAPIFGHAVDTFFYNEMHIPLVIIIGLLNGLSLLLKWNQTNGQHIFKKSLLPVSLSIILTIIIILLGKITDIMMILLILSSSFALFVNLEIAVKIVRSNLKKLGAYVAHIGIALFILGVVGSSAYSSEVNIDLIKGVPAKAFGYKITFTGWRPVENNKKYAFNIDLEKEGSNYNVAPVMYISEYNNGLMREPAILTTLTKDFYISPLGYEDGNSSEGESFSLEIGEEAVVKDVTVLYQSFDSPDAKVMMSGGNFQMGVNLKITKGDASYFVEPLIKREGTSLDYIPAVVNDLNLKIQIKKIDPASQKAEFVLSEIESNNNTDTESKEVLTITASVKPFINLVWLGILIMVTGFFVSAAKRLKESLIK